MHRITTAEAARLYGVTDRTIRGWLKSGRLQGVNPGGGKWLVEVEEKRPAQVLEDDAGQDEVLVSSTLGGKYTWHVY